MTRAPDAGKFLLPPKQQRSGRYGSGDVRSRRRAVQQQDATVMQREAPPLSDYRTESTKRARARGKR